MTVWAMLINLIKSPIPQRWEKWKTDPESISGIGLPQQVYHFYRVTPCSCLACLLDVRYCDRELFCSQNARRTEWPITLLHQSRQSNKGYSDSNTYMTVLHSYPSNVMQRSGKKFTEKNLNKNHLYVHIWVSNVTYMKGATELCVPLKLNCHYL